MNHKQKHYETPKTEKQFFQLIIWEVLKSVSVFLEILFLLSELTNRQAEVYLFQESRQHMIAK